jgi:hypothetical protein
MQSLSTVITVTWRRQDRQMTKRLVCGIYEIHSYSIYCLSYERSKASSKAISLHSAIQIFLLQMRISSPFLKSPSSFLRLLPHFPVNSIPTNIFPSITCYRGQFLSKMWPIQEIYNIIYVRYKNVDRREAPNSLKQN